LGWHDPEPRSEPLPGTVLAVGTDVGIAARLLVPGGILVDEGPDQHAQAVTRTKELIANPDVPAIFEAAFAFDSVLIRADILERLVSGAWRLAEVKSTTRVKPEHLHDLAIQAYVIKGCGIALEQMQLIHVDTTYVRDESGIDWHAYFKPEDLTDEVRDLLASVPERVAEMHAVLGMPTAPEVRPSGHCFSPFECEFWTRCTANKPSDWIFYLPRLNATTFAELDGNGIESMRDIPSDFPLTPGQRHVIETVLSGRDHISQQLQEALAPLGPPAVYLDFETFSPAIPLYQGTCPYQRIPFQWSIHYDDGVGVFIISSSSQMATSIRAENLLKRSYRRSIARPAPSLSTRRSRPASCMISQHFCQIYLGLCGKSSIAFATSCRLFGPMSPIRVS
jgi:hypothetical protein